MSEAVDIWADENESPDRQEGKVGRDGFNRGIV